MLNSLVFVSETSNMGDSMGSSTLKATGPSMSMVDKGSANGVGNYKGVMLCNRPFAGSTTAKVGGGGKDINTFSCGKVPEALGINVSIASKDKGKPKRAKKETVLTKHKRWLADLQKTKDKLEMQYIQEMQEKQDQKDAFQNQEKQMRLMSKELLQGEDKEPAAVPETNGEAKAPASKSNRPAWAMTEAGAKDSGIPTNENKDEFEDDEGLLEFASTLDYDKYIDDIEVQAMVSKLKERIKSLEREVKDEGDRDSAAAERMSKRELLASATELNNMMEAESKNGNEDSELYNIAKLVLDEDGGLDKGVHSQSSVTSMLKQAKEKIASVSASVAEAKAIKEGKNGPSESKVHGGPVIVVHEPSEGTRIEGKQTVSNLPYQHRNPAV